MLASCLLAAACTEGGHDGPLHRPAGSSETRTAPPALAYRENRDVGRGPNADVHDGLSRHLADALPLGGEGAVATDEEREAALGVRARSRAFDGAPPTVPHEVSQRTLDCEGCHTLGGTVAGRTAPKMSHATLPSCTQCHIPQSAPVGLRDARIEDPWAGSAFVGRRGPLRGERAYPGAPPTTPHATTMRGTCDSCHGAAGPLGLRTPHIQQISCTQCHVPSALLDQAPGSEMSK